MQRKLAPLAPYLAVGIGLLVFHNAWLTLLGYHALMLAVLLTDPQGRRRAKDLIQGRTWLILPTGLMGLAGGILIYFFNPLIHLPPDLGNRLVNIGLTPASWMPFILYYSVVNPWIEEWYWRGYLGSPSRSPVLPDLWFAAYHLFVLAAYVTWPWLIMTFAILVATAWIWRQVSRISGGLLAASISHLLADASIIIAIYLLAAKG